ncbi:Rrf2 family transcriptional regulator [Hydrogenophaga sp. OTU3427]|uniref:Rrf2 family transcriptional regulator n=1 Tax=Hydrogenophaga sp. OTU3427 TaxID=3043856 RepID=UPI00313D143D
MRLTTKSTFATTVLLDLAQHAGQGPVSLQSVALRHGVSQSYLEGLFASLKQAGLVLSVRGPGGGYVLGQAPGGISLADISRAVEPHIEDDDRPEDDPASALTAQLYETYSRQLLAYLEGIRLRDAVAGLKTV